MSSIGSVSAGSSYYPPAKPVVSPTTKPAAASTDATAATATSGGGVTLTSKDGDVIALSGKVLNDKDHDGH